MTTVCGGRVRSGAESTYKPPQTLSETLTGAYPPKRITNVAKRKDAAYHTRDSRRECPLPPTVPQVLSRSYPYQVTQLDRSFSFTFMWPLTDITGKWRSQHSGRQAKTSACC